ncbi:MAG: tRNA uridine-5-carboxymethylaminomethyl(34) synthesis GTPase MnmE, partial [Litorimonas sp.]
GLTRARHRDCVERGLAAILRGGLRLDDAPELAGEDLRAALLAIEELSGRADMDAVLDRVFSRFCIGK